MMDADIKPPKTQNSFLINIPVTPMWKIQAIAKWVKTINLTITIQNLICMYYIIFLFIKL
jgi:hypothetical protein